MGKRRAVIALNRAEPSLDAHFSQYVRFLYKMRAPGDRRVVRVVGSVGLADVVCAWMMGSVRAPGAYVCLAVGASTLPLSRALPPDDPAWEDKRILPLDEVEDVPPEQSFHARLVRALPERTRTRCKELPRDVDALESALASDGICVAVLGLGPDGHIAFDQAGDDESTVTRVVELTPENSAASLLRGHAGLTVFVDAAS